MNCQTCPEVDNSTLQTQIYMGVGELFLKRFHSNIIFVVTASQNTHTHFLVRWQIPLIMEKLVMSVYNNIFAYSIVLCRKETVWRVATLHSHSFLESKTGANVMFTLWLAWRMLVAILNRGILSRNHSRSILQRRVPLYIVSRE